MYTEQDLKNIRAQITRRILAVALPCGALMLAAVVFAILRAEPVTTVLTILAGAALIAAWDLAVKPLRCYEQHLVNVLQGRTHELMCEFDCFDEDISLVDGVNYRAMNVTCYDDQAQPYTRMFYYDLEKQLPEFVHGQKIRLIYHDHELALVEAV